MKREDRLYDVAKDDQRSCFQRDRDRILYSSAFRRLAGVTQVVRAGEADVFHNRLTHSIKVAQVGRRLAQRILSEQSVESAEWGVDVEVVEAACLGHDLGHPPFGHVGEGKLDELVRSDQGQGEPDDDGYEGNAQSFRIVTKLAVRFDDREGLDLTRAVLASLLKYPWFRDPTNKKKAKKWGVYSSETPDFNFAKQLIRNETKTAEAEIMDWADDIAYSVHDLEDFHRCQAVPWHSFQQPEGRKHLIDTAIDAWFGSPPRSVAAARLEKAYIRLTRLLKLVPELTRQPYEGTRQQRQQIRFLTSSLIGRYIHGIKLKTKAEVAEGESCVELNSDHEDEIRLLKQITKNFVMESPALAAQQHGYMKIIENLFGYLIEDIIRFPSVRPKIFPNRLRHILDTDSKPRRIVADCISSLTEAEAIALHARLCGSVSGSVLDPIVR